MHMFLIMSVMLVMSCGSLVNESTLCQKTLQDRKELALILADNPDEAAVLQGQKTLNRLKDGCYE